MPQPARLRAASGASKPKRRNMVIGTPLDASRLSRCTVVSFQYAVLIQQYSRAFAAGCAAECSRMFAVTRADFRRLPPSESPPNARDPGFRHRSDKAQSRRCRTVFSFASELTYG